MKILGMLLLLSSFVFAAGSPGSSTVIPLPEPLRDSLPWFAVRNASDGETPFTRTDLLQEAAKRKRIALVYFAIWCENCRDGISKIRSARKELEKNGIGIVLVNVGERDLKLIAKWVRNAGVESYTVVIDPFNRMTEGFGLVKGNSPLSLPQTLVLDSALKPLFLIGTEGTDFPSLFWTK